MARALTEKQQKLLAVLFDEAGGDINVAKRIAGYSDATSSTEIINSLKEEILDATSAYMARNAPKAAMAMVGALYVPAELGIRDKMSAAKDLLDRAGLGKVDKIDVGSSSGGVFILPSKEGKNE